MGQYHVLANLDAREWVDPHRLGLGSKQVEHLGAFYGTLADALYLLTVTSPARGGGDLPCTEVTGRWVGDRVCVLGDYTTNGDIPGFAGAGDVYDRLEDPTLGWVNISDRVAEAMCAAFGVNLQPKETSFIRDNYQHSFTRWARA